MDFVVTVIAISRVVKLEYFVQAFLPAIRFENSIHHDSATYVIVSGSNQSGIS